MEKSRTVEKKRAQRNAPRPPLKISEVPKEVPPPSDALASVKATVTASASGAASRSARKPKPATGGDCEFISKSRSRQKQMRVAEALRGEGFDESALGRAYVKLVRKLLAGKKASGNDKLLVDVLKEISRTLEPANPSGGASASASDGPMIVQLLHDVPRPMRDAPGERSDEAAGGGAFDGRQTT